LHKRRVKERRIQNTSRTKDSGIIMGIQNIMPDSALTLHATSSSNLNFSVLGEPTSLSASFALRYEVYCRERNFLCPENYPSKLERDKYDDCAIHVGSINNCGVMLGTIRLVLPSGRGFPLFEHCKVFPEFSHLAEIQSQQTAAEVSRLAISKHIRKQNSIGEWRLKHNANQELLKMDESGGDPQDLGASHKADIMLGIYRTIYQVSKRQGITHWFAAMEKSLVRLMRRFHFAYTPIGPELDYYGSVTPYMVAIASIEEALYKHCPATYEYFTCDLESEFLPPLM
jgi:N-acyl amino acid synthase of PEP-CTERM/exosortase system